MLAKFSSNSSLKLATAFFNTRTVYEEENFGQGCFLSKEKHTYHLYPYITEI